MAFILPPLPKKPILSREEMFRFANIADDAGQVFLATFVLTPFLTDLDDKAGYMVVSGIFFTICFWTLSLLFTRKATKL